MKIQTIKPIVCDLCGKPGARLRQVSETHGKGRELLVIENVPMVDCPHCGEAYFTAETLHEVERLKRQRRARAVARPVAVLSYT
jgi:YgiT-type zinc finger domain-containing protein